MNVIENIASLDISTTSYIEAIRSLKEQRTYDRMDYGQMVNAIVGGENQFDDHEHARYTLLYVVQEAVRQYNQGENVSAEQLLDYAVNKASDYIKSHSWIFAEPETKPKTDSEGRVKPKKGAKKEMAQDLYKKHKDNKSRKEIIQLFMDEIGMTKAGATTYFHNMKKEFGG